MFLYFLAESLAIRYHAALEMGRSELAARHRARLEALGREDLLSTNILIATTDGEPDRRTASLASVGRPRPRTLEPRTSP